MPTIHEPEILEVEERLRRAMLQSDVAALDELIADDLVFTNHAGAVFSKEQDLAAHRSGAQRLQELELSEARVTGSGDTAVVSVRVQLAGTYAGTPFSGVFRYTRVWRRQEGQWRIIAGHFSPILN